MRDQAISGPRLAKLHPKARAVFQAFIEDVEAHDSETCMRIMQGLRTFPEQQALYAQGRTATGAIVTNSQAGQSYHNYGLAIDLVEMDGANNNVCDWKFDMATIAAIAKKHGLTWGGDFKSIKDKPHFEVSFGYSWQQLKALHDAGKVDKDGYVII